MALAKDGNCPLQISLQCVFVSKYSNDTTGVQDARVTCATLIEPDEEKTPVEDAIDVGGPPAEGSLGES